MMSIQKTLGQIVVAFRNPVQFFYRVVGHIRPEWLYWRYDRLARRQGFNRLYLVISFDCDTPEDIPAAEKIYSFLTTCGLKTTFAVPGHLLQQGAPIYRRIAEDGADFINHGALPHTEWRDGRYWSITFYNEMPSQVIREDIQRGHEIIKQVIGREPTGFRAPHFGVLKVPKDLSIVHSVCRELGYRFSSSTIPFVSFRHGPVWHINGIYEFPVSGSYYSPLSILDSWQYIISPFQPVLQDRYATLFMQTIDRLLELGVVGVLNYYVDPAHVAGSTAFFKAMEYAVERRVESLNYDDLIRVIGSRDA